MSRALSGMGNSWKKAKDGPVDGLLRSLADDGAVVHRLNILLVHYSELSEPPCPTVVRV